MSFHEVLIDMMAVFALLGGLDRILGGRFGLGSRFEEGILSMGSLALAMVGIVSLAPVLAGILKPIVVPVYRLLGADPAMFAGTVLACDMGGGPLARQLTADPQAADLGGVITGSMLGATVVFTIPVAMGILEEEDRPAMAKGILCGMVAIPFGILAGGLTAGYAFSMVLRNLVPIVLMALLIALGLWRAEKAMVAAFTAFGKILVAVVTVGLSGAIIQTLTGFAVIPGLAPISEGFETVGTIAIVLAGAFPLVYVLTRVLNKPLMALGKLLGINEPASAGLIASLANSIATFGMVKDMNPRGKVVNIHATTQLKVVLVKPERFENASEIADHLKEKRTVVLNLESTNKDVARRLIDFLSGVAYAGEGKIKKVAANTYIITPYSVDIMGDLIDELENNGLYF